ncbi:MAG: hypothetical protein KA369_03445 [Spirochaetes bacterium]|nr:hypothetical protein [Spirochaetota bacterium]
MKGPVEIRPVRIDDLRKVFLLGREFFTRRHSPILQDWNETSLADCLAGNRGLGLVAVTKKSVAGFLIASLDEGDGVQTATIRWLCADPSRPAGLMEGLLREFKSLLAGRHIEKILIALPEGNSELIEYYRNFGFTESNRFIIMENFLPK